MNNDSNLYAPILASEIGQALKNCAEAVAFFDQVKRASPSEQIAVGADHWNWLESACRQAADVLGAAPITTQAASDVLAERRRQVEAEGYTTAHDDEHAKGEIACAAACYARIASAWDNYAFPEGCPADWPWSPVYWKWSDPRQDLVKAGALILAEIERLDRKALAREAPVMTETFNTTPTPFQDTGEELERLSKAASQGEWTVERMENEGASSADKFFSYGIECGPHTILDTLNSSGGVLEQENHEDFCTVWDEQARCDLTYIAALVNAHRSGALVLASNEALDIERVAE